MALAELNGNKLYYEVHGQGEPVVLAHGMGGNHATWFQQVDVLARGYRVITFDHRGFGNSEDVQGLGRSGFVEDLKALLDHLDIEKAALVGQSMGAGTAICFACQYPERVKALVIADSLHGIVESDSVSQLMDKAREKTSGLSQLERVLGEKFREENTAEALLYSQINCFNATDRSNLSGSYGSQHSPEEIAALGVPTMFIAGMEDILFPIEAIRLVQEQVAGSFLVEVYQAGHSAFYERPQEFNDSVASLLQMAGLKPQKSAHSNAAGYLAPE